MREKSQAVATVAETIISFQIVETGAKFSSSSMSNIAPETMPASSQIKIILIKQTK